MSQQDPRQVPPLFTQFEVSANASARDSAHKGDAQHEVVGLLQEILTSLDRQSHLLEDLVAQMGASQRQRASELGQWKEANPALVRRCHRAAQSLGKAQTEYLRNLTDEVSQHAESLMESDFMLNDLVDRYGPRLAHLNGVLQVLSQLGNVNDPAKTAE